MTRAQAQTMLESNVSTLHALNPAMQEFLLRALSGRDSTGAIITPEGTFGYRSGTTAAAPSPALPAGCLVRQISVVAGGAGGTVTIAGGQTITVPANTPLDVPVRGLAVAPALAFSGLASFFVAYEV